MPDNQNSQKHPYLTYGISFGLLGGAAIAGILVPYTQTPLIWIIPGLGMLIGIIIGAIMDGNKNKVDK